MTSLEEVKGIDGRNKPIFLLGMYDPDTNRIRITYPSSGFKEDGLVKKLISAEVTSIDELFEAILGKVKTVRDSELKATGTGLEGYLKLKREEFERYKRGEGEFSLQANVVSNEGQIGHIHVIGDQMEEKGMRYFLVCDEYNLTLQKRIGGTRLHEIHNMLVGLDGHIELLLSAIGRGDFSAVERYAKIILERGKMLEAIIKDPLRAKAYEKAEAGRYEKRHVMLKRDIILPVLEELAFMAVNKGITIDFERSLREDVGVFVDPDVFQLPYLELFTNSVKYGRTRITYGYERDQSKINRFDFGENCGVANVYNDCEPSRKIPVEERELIFTPGFRRPALTCPSTGMGLSLAKKVVEGHGGRIRVDPTRGPNEENFQFGIPLYKG